MDKLVTIVLPSFNGSEYIRITIESLLNQTYQNLEIIIVNDCSTDNTLQIIDEYAIKDSRIRVINNDVNCKLPQSLNIGFKNAKGRYFTWTSDDNILAPNAIEALTFELENDNSIDIVYSSYHFIDEAGNKLDTFGSVPEELIFKCAPGACFLYRSEVDRILGGYDETKFRMEDFDFWLRAATKFRYKYIVNDDLYFYRKHSNSLTSAIYSSKDLYNQYRGNHAIAFSYFFKEGLNYNISDEELELHLELYFEDIIKNKNWDFNISEKVLTYVNFLNKLLQLDWAKIGFNETLVKSIIETKKERMVKLVINDLIFENQILQGKNPKLAKQLNKPLSWYYQEYETLPGWYKKVGHVIKALQGNRTWKSLINK